MSGKSKDTFASFMQRSGMQSKRQRRSSKKPSQPIIRSSTTISDRTVGTGTVSTGTVSAGTVSTAATVSADTASTSSTPMGLTPTVYVTGPPGSASSMRPPHQDQQLTEADWQALARMECYHGMMPRDEIECLLEREGDFLIRKSEKHNEVCVVLSVRSHGHVRHFVLKSKQGMWWVNNPNMRKNSLHELILHLVTTREAIYSDGTVLGSGVPRPSYYLFHEQITVKKKLGDGAFGEVFLCTLKDRETVIECACKTLKGDMAKKKRVDFIREARLMRQICHQNVLRVYGVAPQKEPLMIVLELCPRGSLKSHLQKATVAEVSAADIARYCLDVARACDYLFSVHIIHRDIAARNCLLGKDFEVKVSDFGLALQAAGVVVLTEVIRLPTRWLSPETLSSQEFSTKSDVWSYGVLMWELFNRCRSEPYPGLSSAQVREKILTVALPMEPPAEMPLLQELVMRSCFIHEKDDRISFHEIVRLLTPADEAPVN